MKISPERYRQMQLVASYLPLCDCGATAVMLCRDCFPMLQNSVYHYRNAESRIRQGLADVSRVLGVQVRYTPILNSREKSIWVSPTPPNRRILAQAVLPVVNYELDPRNDGIPWLDPLAEKQTSLTDLVPAGL